MRFTTWRKRPIGVGEKREIFLHPDLAYGEFPKPEPNSLIVCDEINELHRSRGNKYQELFGCLNETIQHQLTPEDFDLLGHNLLIIVQKMPSEILKREGV